MFAGFFKTKAPLLKPNLKKMKKVMLFLVIAVNEFAGFSQSIIPCTTDEYERLLIQNNPDMQIAKDRYLDEISRLVTETDKSYKTGAVRIIPVVFHIIHQYGEENISKAQILDQMRVLNEDFRRMNADTVNTRAEFKARSVDTEIEFKLARKDPQGGCTDGITRTYSTLTDGGDNEVKNLIRWDYRKYMNIWIVKKIGREAAGSGIILGYATFPYSTNSSNDGIVMISSRVGTIGTSSKFNAGRTLTHEVGHWIGLYHPFEGGCGGSCNSTGDRICDTPPVIASSNGCPKNNNSCNNDNPDELDMVENYLDYSNGNCQNAFTAGQKAVINAVVSNSSYRGQNVSVTTANATGINTNPTCGPKPDFHTISRRTIVCEGSPLQFEDLSYNDSVADRTWTFEGGSPSISTFINPTVTYTKAGIYKVTLQVSNSSGSNSVTKTAFITVLPATSDIKTPYQESFEIDSIFKKEWNVIEEGSFSWKRNTTISYSGKSCLQAVISSATPVNYRFNVYSPVIDVSALGISNPTLSFRGAYSIADASKSELLVIHASTDCGETWKSVKSLRSNTGLTSVEGVNLNWKPTSQSHWKAQTASLAAYSTTKNLMLRFEAISQSGNSIYIDDINIDRFGLGIPNALGESEFTIYPIPAKEQLTVNFDLALPTDVTLTMTDLTGKTIYLNELTSISKTKYDIDIFSLPAGVYFLKAVAGTYIGIRKVLIIKN
jgi:PKD repeat protein